MDNEWLMMVCNGQYPLDQLPPLVSSIDANHKLQLSRAGNHLLPDLFGFWGFLLPWVNLINIRATQQDAIDWHGGDVDTEGCVASDVAWQRIMSSSIMPQGTVWYGELMSFSHV